VLYIFGFLVFTVGVVGLFVTSDYTVRLVPEMTWYMLSGTLNSTHSLTHYRSELKRKQRVSQQTRFEIIMNDWRLNLVEVSEGRDCLNNDRPCLLLRQKLVLLQIEVEVVAFAVT